MENKELKAKDIPQQQADILAIIAKFCPIEGVKFDHYVIDWDFD